MKKIGIIGLGGISKKHIKELKNIPECEIYTICDIDEIKLAKAGDELCIPAQLRFTDYREMLQLKELDAVEICTPNYLHVPMAVDAVNAGKAINVEKPLSVNCESAKPLIKALEKKDVKNTMCFSYRFMPAVRYAKILLDKKIIGDIVNINVEYLKDSAFMKGRRLEWRFIKEYAGTGVLGDLGVHLIDMAELLTGKIQSVSGVADVIIKERMYLDRDEYGKVETDDYCSFIAKIEGGINAGFMITRCAIGHSNTIKYDIYGTKGVISFDLNNPNVLGICTVEGEFEAKTVQTVTVPEEFKITQEQMFVDLLHDKPCEYLPTVADGFRYQQILDSLLLSSVENRWVDIN